jgi:hypothetical protein
MCRRELLGQPDPLQQIHHHHNRHVWSRRIAQRSL